MEKEKEEGGEEAETMLMPVVHHLFELHGELFLQVLLRLPFKYLIRLRCVSNSLLDLTNNPDFISFYLLQSKANPPNFFKDFNFIDTVPRFSPPTSSSSSIDDVDTNLWRFHIVIKGSNFIYLGHHGLTPFRCPDRKYLVSSSSDGMICYAGLNSLEICNILSGVNYLVESNMVDPLWNSLTYPTYVFGFDPKSNDYKVVCFHHDSKWRKVFSFRNNSWKPLVLATLCSSATIWTNAEEGLTICINGVIYWPLHPRDLEEGIGFVSFNLHQQRFEPILPPPLDGVLPNTQCSYLQLLPFRGCPCFAYMKTSRKVGKRTTTTKSRKGAAAAAAEETSHSGVGGGGGGGCGFRVELFILKNSGGGGGGGGGDDNNGENNEYYWIRETIVTPFCLPHEVQIVSLCDQIFLAWFEAKHLRLYNLHTKGFFKLPRSPPSVCHPKVSRSNTKHNPTYVENLRFYFPSI